MKTFIERCLSGERIDINDAISDWHCSHGTQSVYDFLGITWEQYKSWVENKVTTKEIVDSYRAPKK